MTANLVLHAGARPVTLEELRELPTPEPKGRFHRPLRFDNLVDNVLSAFDALGATREGVRLGINPTATKLFGTLDLFPVGQNGTFGKAVGFRTSTDETMALQLVAGARVFVCDNMAFSGGEVALRRLNNTRLDLVAEICGIVPKIQGQVEIFERSFAALQERPLSDDRASGLLVQAMREHAMLPNDAAQAADIYFAPNVAERAPEIAGFERTEWALHNAMTRTMRECTPAVRYHRTVALGKLFGV